MNIEFQDHFDPTYECVYLLTQHFAPPDSPHSIQDIANLLVERNSIPRPEIEALTAAVSEAESYILQNLDVPEDTLHFYFDSSLGNWFTLASALYDMQQAGIQFDQLTPQQRLPAQRYLLSRILDCRIEQLKAVEDMPGLLRFLRGYSRIDHYKYVCIQAFCDPEACQAEFAQIMEQAVSLFQQIAEPFLPLIASATHAFQSNMQPGVQSLIDIVPQELPVIFVPTLMQFDGIVLKQHGDLPANLYYGVFFDAIGALNKKYCQDTNSLSRKLKTLSDVRRFNILLELKTKPLCGQDIGDKLGLSPATVSYHMASLLYDNFVCAERQGIYTLYSLSRPNLQAFIQALQNKLL